MNCKLVFLEVFAIFVAYLVFSISLVSATNVKIYYNGVYQSPPVSYNPQSLVSKSVAVEAGSVKINITNATGAVQIARVYVFNCKGLSPASCMSVTPDTANGTFGASYPWSSVADRSSGYPQKASFVILVKAISSGKTFWTGFWQSIERSDASTYTPSENQLSEIQVHAKDIDDVASIRNFIASNKMIPFNPQWVLKAVFPVASGGLFMIKASLSGIESQQFSSSGTQQNQLTSLDQDYGFAFANITGESAIFSPITLNLNPSYNCGNNNCESQIGETSANCCMDCQCSSGSYCDVSGSCRLSSGITLSLQGTPQTTVSNCNEQHTLNITVRINNPPTSATVGSTKFRLGSGSEQATSCSGGSQTGYIFSCLVAVPAVQNCNAGTYRVGPNFLNFSITYPNGNSTASKSLSASFPDITIGSYSCGNRVCESSLGENPSMCCFDCGCPNGYCDVQPASTNGSCRQDPTTLQASAPSPASFYTHSSGDSARFSAEIANSPVTLSVAQNTCSIRCTRNDGQPCSSSCQISCSKTASSIMSVYNSSCLLSFTMPAYDSLKGYSLSPAINFSVSYKNGSSQTEQKVLSTTVPAINIGSHWCGDRKCDPDESPGSCCYDCGCPSGQYCNTQDIAVFTQGDSCRQNPRVETDSTSSTTFTSSYEEHVINITGHIDSVPSGISLVPKCAYGTSPGFPCYVSCEGNLSSGVYMFLCRIAIPEIDYNTSATYSPVTKKITFSSNSLNLTLSYNNASATARDEFSFEIPDIVINVVPKCGNQDCEKGIGENGRTCCADCGCRQDYGTGYFCYQGKSPNGECLSTSTINMRIRTIDPNPINCTIFEQGKGCSFTESLKIYPAVLNPPSDLAVVDSYYRLGNSGSYTPLTCLELNGKGNYSCALALDNINKTNPGTENRTIELKITFGYSASGSTALMVRNYSDTAGFTVKKVYSEAVASCISQQQSIDKKIASLESDKSLYTALVVVFLLLTLIFWIFTYLCYSSNSIVGGAGGAACINYQNMAVIAGTLTACALSYILSSLDSVDQQIQQLQVQRQSICGASTFGDLSKATSNSGISVLGIGKIAAGVACALGAASSISVIASGSTIIPGLGGAVSGIFSSISKNNQEGNKALGQYNEPTTPVSPISKGISTFGDRG